MPKAFSLQSKQLITSLISYFEKERDNGGPLLPLTAVRERVADALGISRNAVGRVSATVKSGNMLSEAKNPAKKKKKPVIDLDNNQQLALRDAIYDMFEKKIPVHLDSILNFCKERLLFEGGKSSLNELLHKMGFKWKKTNNRRALMEQHYVVQKRLQFLGKYMTLTNDLNHKQFVYLDETWSFQNGCQSGMSWQDDSHKSAKTLKSEGKRYIVLHAGSKDGFVPNADLIFASKSIQGDYHREMNNDFVTCLFGSAPMKKNL